MKSSWSLLRILGIAVLTLLSVAAGSPWASAQVALDEPSLSTAAASIRAVRYHVEPSQTRVWLETEGAVLYTHYSPDPLTLVVDLPGVDISQVAERTVVGSREVESVLATSLQGPNGKNLSRVEIKLATIVPYQLSGSEHALNIVFDGPVPAVDSTSPETIAEQPIVTEPISPPTPEPAPVTTAMAEVPDAAPTPPRRDPVSTPVAPSMDGPLASSVRALSHRLDGGVLSFDVDADGRLSYSSFELDAPRRLVFDFDGVMNNVSVDTMPVERMGIARARIGQFRSADPSITRLVFDLDDDVFVQANPRNDGLRIQFSYSQENISPTAAVGSNPPPYVANALAAMSPETMGTTSTQSDTQASPSAPVTSISLDDSSEMIDVSLDGDTATVSDAAYQPMDSESVYEEEGIYIDNSGVVVASQDLGFANPGPSVPSLPVPPPALTEPPQDTGSVLSSGSQNLGERQYTGELITLDFKDGDIQDIFRLFADISGLNIVVQPGVSGRITLKLTEVPWDQALELILKTNKLGYVVEGNVIRIAPLSELATEEAERRRLAEEKALAGELFTQTRVLSYAKASEIEPLLKRNLSARGDIVIDERTNTIIYTDLAEQITSINALVETLDTPIPGVEIESRIVVTTRTFSRNLGVQWGFTSNQTQRLGNTTELVFPNRIQVGGQGIGNTDDDEFVAPGADAGGGLIPPESNGNRRGYAVNLPFAGAPTGAIGLSLGSITGAFSVDAALSAAERRGHVRIISAPKIITQNNKPAEIKQGVTFPVQVVANNTITVQFKDAVLQLQVTPQITSADTIILDIVVNNDSLDFGQQVQGIPSIVTQSATTQVLVADGSTTVIGGVFVNRQQEDERFVPLLHKIPILGNLFKSRDASSRNEELLIFLTPRIRKDTA